MELRTGDFRISIRIAEETTETSPHTGKELRRIRAECAISHQQKEQLRAALKKDVNVTLCDHEGRELGTYSAKLGSFVHRQAASLGQGTIELSEVEILHPSSLVIGDLEVEPVEFEETADDGSLCIAARFDPDLDGAHYLFELPHESTYFPVVRHGLSDDVKSMRFGKCIWSQAGEAVKHRVTLVEETYDQGVSKPGLLSDYPEANNVQDMLADQIEILAQLIERLQAKGILLEEEVEAVRTVARKAHLRRLADFYKVRDVDNVEW